MSICRATLFLRVVHVCWLLAVCVMSVKVVGAAACVWCMSVLVGCSAHVCDARVCGGWLQSGNWWKLEEDPKKAAALKSSDPSAGIMDMMRDMYGHRVLNLNPNPHPTPSPHCYAITHAGRGWSLFCWPWLYSAPACSSRLCLRGEVVVTVGVTVAAVALVAWMHLFRQVQRWRRRHEGELSPSVCWPCSVPAAALLSPKHRARATHVLIV